MSASDDLKTTDRGLTKADQFGEWLAVIAANLVGDPKKWMRYFERGLTPTTAIEEEIRDRSGRRHG